MLRSMRLTPVAALLLVACARPDVLAVEQPRPARDPSSVELLLDAPDRSFRTVALIRSSNKNPIRNLDRLKRDVLEAAAAVGADAVILALAGQDTPGGTGVASDGQQVMVGGSSDLRIVGRAIVFTDG